MHIDWVAGLRRLVFDEFLLTIDSKVLPVIVIMDDVFGTQLTILLTEGVILEI